MFPLRQAQGLRRAQHDEARHAFSFIIDLGINLKVSPKMPPHFLRARLHGLYVITQESTLHSSGPVSHELIARAAIAGGARIIQLRDKSTPLRELLPIASRLRALTRRTHTIFIINDRPDLALACDADGVHLGPDDLPLAAARRVLGPHRLIGVSCSTPYEARAAEAGGADYIGAGDIFGTTTKLDAGAPIGLDGLRALSDATSLPVAAIGGVHAGNIASLRSHGATMACVVSAVAQAGDEAAMTQAAKHLATLWEAASA
jgi:thiamine-phosphate pyrophosphorylase